MPIQSCIRSRCVKISDSIIRESVLCECGIRGGCEIDTMCVIPNDVSREIRVIREIGPDTKHIVLNHAVGDVDIIAICNQYARFFPLVFVPCCVSQSEPINND